MPINVPEPGSAADWLRYARSDLALSKAPRSGDILFETLCFHAQQAAEKSVKAVLIHFGITHDRTHNLRTLLSQVQVACAVPQSVIEAAGLSDYAVAMRYPGERESIEEEEYLTSIAMAERVVRWAERIVD